MGQAKRRGSYEERKAQAIEARITKIKAMDDADDRRYMASPRRRRMPPALLVATALAMGAGLR